MAINKKNLLGKTPPELGDKDAIHVAIVAVRAGAALKPGQRCGLNEHREAVPNPKGCGLVDPFLRSPVARGESFWLVMDLQEIPNVAHTWEHPAIQFTPPDRPPERNKYLERYAAELGVTYEQLMDACRTLVVADNPRYAEPVAYPGTKTEEEIEQAIEEYRVEMTELWAEWSDETGHDFPNVGTECCPDYLYPEDPLFCFPKPDTAEEQA